MPSVTLLVPERAWSVTRSSSHNLCMTRPTGDVCTVLAGSSGHRFLPISLRDRAQIRKCTGRQHLVQEQKEVGSQDSCVL